MYDHDASRGVFFLTANRINAVSRHARTLLPHTPGTLSIVLILEVSYPEMCNLIGVLKFLDRYRQDVHESPDPLSLFQPRSG